MARTNNLTNFLTDVSSAIKQKTGDDTPIPASQFDTKIASIETGGTYQEKELTINQNGNYTLLPDTGYDAINRVSIGVNVAGGSGDTILDVGNLYPSVSGTTLIFKDTSHTEIDYIESTGTQYINTGIATDLSSAYKFKTKFLYTTSAGDGFIWSDFNNDQYGLGNLYRDKMNSKFAYFYGNNKSVYITSPAYTDGTVYEMESTQTANKITTVLNGVTSTQTSGVSSLTGNNIFLFKRGNNSSYAGQFRLYYFQIYKDDTLIRDFVPVFTKDSVYALYDKVSKTYFYNAGTGAFTGPHPGEATPVEKTNLSGASINANYSMTNNTKIELKVNVLQNTAWANVFNNNNGYYLQQNSSAYSYTFGYNNNFVTREISINWNSNPKILIFENNKIYVDETLVAEGSSTSINTNSSITVNNSKVSMDFYYMKIYENNELVHNYIPREYTDGAAEIYDTVTKTVIEI